MIDLQLMNDEELVAEHKRVHALMEEAGDVWASYKERNDEILKERGRRGARGFNRMILKGEHVSCAAILLNGVMHTLPRPARHHDIMHAIEEPHGAEQGFMTSRGRYVNREQAMLIAQEAGQLAVNDIGKLKLYSEDLW